MSSDDDSKDCKWIEKGYLPPVKKYYTKEPGAAGELATPPLEGDEGEAPTAKEVNEEEIKAEEPPPEIGEEGNDNDHREEPIEACELCKRTNQVWLSMVEKHADNDKVIFADMITSDFPDVVKKIKETMAAAQPRHDILDAVDKQDKGGNDLPPVPDVPGDEITEVPMEPEEPDEADRLPADGLFGAIGLLGPRHLSSLTTCVVELLCVTAEEELSRAETDPEHGGCTIRHYNGVTGSYLPDWTPHCAEMLEDGPVDVRHRAYHYVILSLW